MAIAINFVQYDSAPPFTNAQEVPILDWGTATPGTTSDLTHRQALGLRIQGQSVQNIKVWLDGDTVDLYPQGQPAQLQQSFSGSGFGLQALRIDGTSQAARDLAVSVYEHADLSGWSTLGTSEAAALPLGDARIGPAMDTFSDVFALAITVPSLASPTDVNNFRLMASFDTLDD